MSHTSSLADARGDAELISAVRGGDTAAYGELYHRHCEAAHRLARQLVRGGDSDDLVSEAFAKVLEVLQRGGGPDLAFRAYLLTSVRRLHVDRIRRQQRLHHTDDLTPFDPGVPFRDTAVEGFESAAAARAFASLPERWQLVLWHTEVEGQRPAEVAPLLGISANSVAALAYRAREGLREAFLSMHAQEIDDADCEWTHQHLGAFVRGGLSKRDSAKVRAHLNECRRCTAVYVELTDVNAGLAAVLGPLLLGTAAAGYLTGTTPVHVTALPVLHRVRDVVAGHAPASVAAGVAASVVLGGLFVMGQRHPEDTTAATSTPTSGIGTDDPQATVSRHFPIHRGIHGGPARGATSGSPSATTSTPTPSATSQPVPSATPASTPGQPTSGPAEDKPTDARPQPGPQPSSGLGVSVSVHRNSQTSYDVTVTVTGANGDHQVTAHIP